MADPGKADESSQVQSLPTPGIEPLTNSISGIDPVTMPTSGMEPVTKLQPSNENVQPPIVLVWTRALVHPNASGLVCAADQSTVIGLPLNCLDVDGFSTANGGLVTPRHVHILSVSRPFAPSSQYLYPSSIYCHHYQLLLVRLMARLSDLTGARFEQGAADKARTRCYLAWLLE